MLQPLIDSDDEPELVLSDSDETIQINTAEDTEQHQFNYEDLNPDEINLELYEEEEEPVVQKIKPQGPTTFDSLEQQIIDNCNKDYFYLLYQMRAKMKNLSSAERQASKNRMLKAIKERLSDIDYLNVCMIFNNYFN